MLRSRSHNKLGTMVRDRKIHYEIRREKPWQMYNGTILKPRLSNNENSIKAKATQRI